jgi:hypothetical protein
MGNRLGGRRRRTGWRRRSRGQHRRRRWPQGREVRVPERLRGGPAVAGRRQSHAQAEVGRNWGSQLEHDHQRGDRDRSARCVDGRRQPPATTRSARSHRSMSPSRPRMTGPRHWHVTNFRLSSLPASLNPSSSETRNLRRRPGRKSWDLTYGLRCNGPSGLRKSPRNFLDATLGPRSRARPMATISVGWRKRTAESVGL